MYMQSAHIVDRFQQVEVEVGFHGDWTDTVPKFNSFQNHQGVRNIYCVPSIRTRRIWSSGAADLRAAGTVYLIYPTGIGTFTPEVSIPEHKL